jgi:signal transduction histidine kinase
MKPRKPLRLRFSTGLREQPAWVFIGFLFFVVGLGYGTGLAESLISKSVGALTLMLWGWSLTGTGLLLMVATIRSRPAMEKLALRAITCNLSAYALWLLTVTTLARSATILAMSVGLIGAAEFRVLHLRALVKKSSEMNDFLKDRKLDD